MAACTLVVQLSSSGDLLAASSPPISGEVAYLLERLDEPEFEAQRDALRSLEEMGGEAVAGLVSMMQRVDAPRREQAIELLGRLNSAASPARPMLMAALTDPVYRVRRQAAWALGRIGSPDGRTDGPSIRSERRFGWP
jgi:HEAT repeat protein